MKTKRNKDGTTTHTYHFTDEYPIVISPNPNGESWSITFFDDGDPVVIEYVSRPQMVTLLKELSQELKGN